MSTTHHLSRDEFDALQQVQELKKTDKPSACIGRNSKRLVGIKFMSIRKDGSFALTEKGTEALFVNQCLAGLRALGETASGPLDQAVGNFLGRKGYVNALAVAGQFEITAKGRACLEDIALNP